MGDISLTTHVIGEPKRKKCLAQPKIENNVLHGNTTVQDLIFDRSPEVETTLYVNLYYDRDTNPDKCSPRSTP